MRFEPLGNRDLKGTGLVDLYSVTLGKAPNDVGGCWCAEANTWCRNAKKKDQAQSLSYRLLISAPSVIRKTLVTVLQRKYSTSLVKWAVFTFRQGHPASLFAEPPWTREKSGGGLASRRFWTAAFVKRENVFGSACNSLTRKTATNSGRNASIVRLKTSSRSRTRSPEAYWSR